MASIDTSIVVTLVAIVVSATVAVVSIMVNARTSRITSFRALLEEVGTEEIRTLRHQVRENPHDTPHDPERIKAENRVAVSFDRIGLILHQDSRLKKDFLKSNAGMLADIWLAVEPTVRSERMSKTPRHVEHFVLLAQEAIRNLTPEELHVIEKNHKKRWQFDWANGRLTRIFDVVDPPNTAYPFRG